MVDSNTAVTRRRWFERLGASTLLRSLGQDGLHLVGLSAFAVAQPLLEVLGRSAQLFTFHGAGPTEIVAVALTVLFLPPAALIGLELAVLASGGPHLRRAVHLVFIGVLGALLTSPIIKRTGTDLDAVVVVLAILGGAGVALGYRYLRYVRVFLAISASGVLVFGLNFIFLSDLSGLMSPVEPQPIPAALVPGSGPPVVLVVFDELPTVSLMNEELLVDERRFPNFARLAERSTWFRNATTVSDVTTQALPAILSGTRMLPHVGMSSVFVPRSVFTLLGGAYEVRNHGTDLCPSTVCTGETPELRGWSTRLRKRAVARVLRDGVVVLGHVLAPREMARSLPTFAQLAVRGVPDQPPEGTHGAPDARWGAYVESLGRIRSADRPTLDVVYSFLPTVRGPWTLRA